MVYGQEGFGQSGWYRGYYFDIRPGQVISCPGFLFVSLVEKFIKRRMKMKRELTNVMTGKMEAGVLRRKAPLAIAAALIAFSLMG